MGTHASLLASAVGLLGCSCLTVMHVPQKSLSTFLSYKHQLVDSGPTGIPCDLILLTAAKPRFLHEVPFQGSGGRKFWGTVIPQPWPLLGASLLWSSPHPPAPGRMGGFQSPSTVAQSHWCLWASQVPRTGQQPPHSLWAPGPRYPSHQWALTLPGTSSQSSLGPWPWLQALLPSDGRQHLSYLVTPHYTRGVGTDPGLSCKWGPRGGCCWAFLGHLEGPMEES